MYGLTRLDYALTGIGRVSRLNVTTRRAHRRIRETGSYQMYFNTDAVLDLADALGPSPLPLEQRYDLFGHSFRGAARTRAVRRVIGLIIVRIECADRTLYCKLTILGLLPRPIGYTFACHLGTVPAWRRTERKNYDHDACTHFKGTHCVVGP